MSNTKVVFLENIIDEPSYENYKKSQITMLENADKLRSSLPSQTITIQEFLEADLTKKMLSLIGLSATREIHLNINVYPEYEYDFMSSDELNDYFSEDEDLKHQLQGKQVMSVTKLKNGFIVNAVDSRYYEKLKEYQEKLDTQVPSPIGFPSEESDEEFIEAIRNAM